MDHHVEVVVKCRYTEKGTAERIRETVEPDNGDFIRSWVDDGELISAAQSDTILSLRSTLDDFLACLFTAEQVMRGKDR